MKGIDCDNEKKRRGFIYDCIVLFHVYVEIEREREIWWILYLIIKYNVK